MIIPLSPAFHLVNVLFLHSRVFHFVEHEVVFADLMPRSRDGRGHRPAGTVDVPRGSLLRHSRSGRGSGRSISVELLWRRAATHRGSVDSCCQVVAVAMAIAMRGEVLLVLPVKLQAVLLKDTGQHGKSLDIV